MHDGNEFTMTMTAGDATTGPFTVDEVMVANQTNGPRGVIRIIARRCPWTSSPGARLRWDALTEDGELLAEATEWPLEGGAHALALRGVPGDALVTMRHAGSSFDSFRPMPLRVPAAKGRCRAEVRDRMAHRDEATREKHGNSTMPATTLPETQDGPVRPEYEALRP